jgi:hypothetical protein
VNAFWGSDLSKTIADATEIASHASASSPHLSAWLEGYDEDSPTSSYSGSYDLPFQRWMKFKEAFSPKFVVDAISSMPFTPRRCADPFGGSGTTALTCSFLGVDAVTIEVNPFLADLIEAKLSPPPAFGFSTEYAAVLARMRSQKPDVARMVARLPATFCEPAGGSGPEGPGARRFVFWREAIDRILALRSAIEDCGCDRSRLLLKVLLGSILVQASNVVVNGKGRRYRGGWEKRRVSAADVDGMFTQAVGRAVRDLGSFGRRSSTQGTLLRGDSRELASQLGPIDAAIFSPPYPNSFDYTDVYNLELWVLGYLDDALSNKRLRQSTLRSHVQVSFPDPTIAPSGTLGETMGKLIDARGKLWDPRIPEMVLGYFEDMDRVMRGVRDNMRPGGQMVMVVGDSRYAHIHVDVATILRERAEEMGFAAISNKAMRSMRSSAQHGGRHDLAESCIVMERR